ncbi:MAG: NAD(P)-dependent alcohol dehydrogenase [Bacteroidales bacterium]|nr:NAD(P)-dependent alcohol dehydrogenase [Bacteroidales bacterium]
MKAIVYTEYGLPEVLQIKEVEKPDPIGNEVLVRVRAVSVNYGDIIARNFRNVSTREFNMLPLFWILARFGFGFNKPKRKILGNTFAGEIESVGNEVKQFREKELVFGYTGEKMGTYAEYLCMPENGIIAVKPSNMTFEEASVIPYGTLMALNLLKRVNLQKGQKVLIIGASGGIGSAAVQLAKHYFGAEVTGVCSTPGLEFVKKLGADKVLDYTKKDYLQSEEIYDLIFDILGKGSFSKYKKSLKETGICLFASFKSKKLLQMIWTSIKGGKKVVCSLSIPKTEDLIFVKKLIEEGKIKSIIDKCFPFGQTSEAHKYIEAGNKKATW